MVRARIIVAALVGGLTAASGGAPPARATPPPGASVEEYVYSATPDDGGGGATETHRVRITTDSSSVVYAFDIDRGDTRENGWIRTGLNGAFQDAVRTVVDAGGAVAESDTIRVEGRSLVMIRMDPGGRESKRAQIREEPLAVDASLLIRLRSFPLGKSASREMFMADWSQRTVHVDVHDRGLETITVPAGTFSCYRIEVVVKVFIFRPKITFWVSAESPHFLVRHRGKRGPFTPVFHTRLVERGQP